jgi:hypothetical protein
MANPERDPYVEMSRAGRKWVLNTGDAVTLAGAAYFLYVANDASQGDIWIPHINATASAAGVFTLEVVTGTAAGGSAPTAKAGKVGGAVMTGITTRLHTAVTGLTGTDILATSHRTAGGDPNLVHESHGLVLPAGSALAVQFSAAADVTGEIHMVR